LSGQDGSNYPVALAGNDILIGGAESNTLQGASATTWISCRPPATTRSDP
jgi:hypothetical protein